MFRLFKPKKIIFKGRAGLIFNLNKNESYYVDSEMLTGEYDIVIYKNNIRKLPENQKVSNNVRNSVLELLIGELKKRNMRCEIEE